MEEEGDQQTSFCLKFLQYLSPGHDSQGMQKYGVSPTAERSWLLLLYRSNHPLCKLTTFHAELGSIVEIYGRFFMCVILVIGTGNMNE